MSPDVLLWQSLPLACAQGTSHGPAHLGAPETTPCCPSQLPGAGCVLSAPKMPGWDSHPLGGEEPGQTLHDPRADVSGQRPA